MKSTNYIYIIAGAILTIIIYTLFRFVFLMTNYETMYIASEKETLSINGIEIVRGTEVKYDSKKKEVLYDNNRYSIDSKYLKENIEDIDLEKEKYIRTSSVIYKDINKGTILSLALKGNKINLLNGINLKDNGEYEYYKITYNDLEGYIYSKYLVDTEEESLNQYTDIHNKRTNTLGGGSAETLDYYPREKLISETNIMPDPVYAWFLNSYVATKDNIEEYIDLAKQTNINTFVLDIKDNKSPAYKGNIFKDYSPTNYEKAYKTVEEYKYIVDRLKEEGFYLVGRITVFKDSYFINDNPEYAILDTRTNGPFKHDGEYWPSAYQRKVWEFNVNLAKEAVELFGFNEIQFDYVRFPDRTSSYEKSGIMNFRNIYNESKAEAIQRFLMYATDELHKMDVYVAADVFGEAAHTYVTAYGQYWPAISNVVDVICPMPYPDHFNKYQYDFSVPVWTVPYDLLKYWGTTYASKRQAETTSPAKVRTWIQVYDPTRTPKTDYTNKEIDGQIKALFESNLTDGYMSWNVLGRISKYVEHMETYKKEYKEEL